MKKYYEILINGMPEELTVTRIVRGLSWVGAELSSGSFGIAMNTAGESIGRLFPCLTGLSAKKAAEAVMSWNMAEASEGMAVINAFYNSQERLESLGCAVPYSLVCTDGMDMRGKNTALIGHLSMPEETLAGAEKVYIIEKREIEGDYPDSACEYILPECDIVIITASASVNKTMPRLLELSENARTVIIGPTCPMCPELIENTGVNRLSGMVVRDKEALIDWMQREYGNPYPFGDVFLIKDEP